MQARLLKEIRCNEAFADSKRTTTGATSMTTTNTTKPTTTTNVVININETTLRGTYLTDWYPLRPTHSHLKRLQNFPDLMRKWNTLTTLKTSTNYLSLLNDKIINTNSISYVTLLQSLTTAILSPSVVHSLTTSLSKPVAHPIHDYGSLLKGSKGRFFGFYATWERDEWWFPVAFLTDNYEWATCPRSLRSGLR